MEINKNSSRDFTDLTVWKSANQLMIDIYQFTKFLPAEEKYNLVSQLKRAASSVAANIAEGYGRYYYQDNIAFCRKARGSLDETKNHIIAVRDLQQAPQDKCNKLIEQCNQSRQLLNGYIRYLNKKKPQ